jgi:hypothetical protein
MAGISRVLKYLLLLILAFVLVGVSAGLWLRFEFSRSVVPSGTAADWSQIPVAAAPGATADTGCTQQHPYPQAWFGALHVHTSASYDATAFGTAATVDDAYRFGRGEPLALRLKFDPPGYRAPVLRISSPLDFMAVTDHAEALGETSLCYDPQSESYPALVCRLFRGDLRLPVEDQLQPLVRIATQAIFGQDRSARVCGKNGSRCRQRAVEVWHNNQRSTEAWHDRSGDCAFTTLHGYEYTLAQEASNLHRNVIFSSGTVPQAPLSAKDADTPEQLWQWLQQTCIDGNADCDALAIPHNSNWSSGRMWFPYSRRDWPVEQQQQMARLRARLEPLAEIMQVKGDSECRNGITSVLGSADEFCDFEKLRSPAEQIPDCGEAFGSGGMMLQGCASRYSYVRYALTAGLSEQEKLGINPFKLGIVAATDTHIGAPAAGLERGHMGSHGIDRDPRHRLQGEVEVPGGIGTGSPARYNPGGIAGIYAVENSRKALFGAMQRRETFGTSGPRIRPRLFAGWKLDAAICKSTDFLQQAYAGGVPMGADLPPPPTGVLRSPLFVASASRDPRPGANLLQRIQIIKGWVDEQGQTHQAVYDIAGNPDNDASVNPSSCEVSGTGFEQLCGTWQDPDFDSQQAAVYYSRVLENPACRWSHYDCLALPQGERPAMCDDPELPWQIQERAWTSPIWYQPQ